MAGLDAIIHQIEARYTKQARPAFKAGDTVRVHLKVKEGEKERVQVFEGVVLGCEKSGARESFRVRRIASGVGVERVFPLYSPTVAKIERVRQGRVRRARLYYLRDRVGKRARVREKSALSSRMIKAREEAKVAKAEALAAKQKAKADEKAAKAKAAKAEAKAPAAEAPSTAEE